MKKFLYRYYEDGIAYGSSFMAVGYSAAKAMCKSKGWRLEEDAARMPHFSRAERYEGPT